MNNNNYQTPESSSRLSEETKPKAETNTRINFPVPGSLHLVIVLVATHPLNEVCMKGDMKKVVEWTAYNSQGEKCKLTSIGNFAQEIYDDFV